MVDAVWQKGFHEYQSFLKEERRTTKNSPFCVGSFLEGTIGHRRNKLLPFLPGASALPLLVLSSKTTTFYVHTWYSRPQTPVSRTQEIAH